MIAMLSLLLAMQVRPASDVAAVVSLEAPAVVRAGSTLLVDATNSNSSGAIRWVVRPDVPALALDYQGKRGVFLAVRQIPAGVYTVTAVAVGKVTSGEDSVAVDTVTVIAGADAATETPQPGAGQTDRPVTRSIQITVTPPGAALASRPRWVYLLDRLKFTMAEQRPDGFWAIRHDRLYDRPYPPQGDVPTGYSDTTEGRALFAEVRASGQPVASSVPSDRVPSVQVQRSGQPPLHGGSPP